MSVFSALSSFFHRSHSYDLAAAATANGLVRRPAVASEAPTQAKVVALLREALTSLQPPATSEAKQLSKEIACLLDHTLRNWDKEESAPLPTLQQAQVLSERAKFDPAVRPTALPSLQADMRALMQLVERPHAVSMIDLGRTLGSLSDDVEALSVSDAQPSASAGRIAELHKRVSGMRELIEDRLQHRDVWTVLTHGQQPARALFSAGHRLPGQP